MSTPAPSNVGRARADGGLWASSRQNFRDGETITLGIDLFLDLELRSPPVQARQTRAQPRKF